MLLDWYRGRVLDHDPLYEPPADNADFAIGAMLEQEFYTRIAPVLDRIKNMPELIDISDGYSFYEHCGDRFWVKGIELWYWKLWSVKNTPSVCTTSPSPKCP